MTNHVPMSERPPIMVTVDGSKLIFSSSYGQKVFDKNEQHNHEEILDLACMIYDLSVNHQNVLSIHKSAIHLVGEMDEIKGE